MTEIYENALILVTDENKGTGKFIYPDAISDEQYIHSAQLKPIPANTYVNAQVIVDHTLPRLQKVHDHFPASEPVYMIATYRKTNAKTLTAMWNILSKYVTRIDEATFKKLAKDNENLIVSFMTMGETAPLFAEISQKLSNDDIILSFDRGEFVEENAPVVLDAIQERIEVDLSNPYRIPENGWIENFHVPADMRVLFENIAPKVIHDGACYIARFVGESGNGKTVSAKALANHLSKIMGGEPVKFLKVSVPNLLDTLQIFGQPKAKDGSTFFELSDFSHIIGEGRCVILLDEVNRAPRYMLNSLLAMFDGTGSTTVENHTIVRGDIKHGKNHGIVVIFTMNAGNQYAVEEMDAALKNRCKATYEVTRYERNELVKMLCEKYNVRKGDKGNPIISIDDVKKLVNIIEEFEKIGGGMVDLSHRSCEYVLDNMEYGMSLTQAVNSVIVKSIDNFADRKGYMDKLLAITGGFE